MQKFTHLHAKIRSVRKRLGLQQKDFIVQVSEKLGRDKPLTPGLASQWESNLIKSRTTPLHEQLEAIAALTKDPDQTLAWFLNDELSAESLHDAQTDGADPYDEKLNSWLDRFQRVYDQFEEPKSGEQTISLKQDPEKALRAFLHITRLGNPTTELPELRASTIDSKALQSKKARDERIESGAGLPSPLTSDFEGPLSQVSQELVARRPRFVGDLVAFKTAQAITSFEGDMLRGTGELSVNEGIVKRREAFNGAMEYSLIEDHGIHDAHLGLNRRITSGAISRKASFFSHGVSVQIYLFEASMPLGFVPSRVTDAIGELLLIDRMQNRSAKKMVLLCSSEKRLDLSKLEEHYNDLVQSAGLLGIKIKIAVGPDGAAQAIADLIKSS